MRCIYSISRKPIQNEVIMSESTIQAVQLDDGTTIYIEVRQPINFVVEPEVVPKVESRELSREDLGGDTKGLKEIVAKMITTILMLLYCRNTSSKYRDLKVYATGHRSNLNLCYRNIS